MGIFTATISILAIAGVVWIANKILPLRICPICAGVSGTWLWMLAGMFSGLLPTSDFQLPTAILMGGTVVGIAYQLEKYLPQNQSPLLWKILFVPAGFAAVYAVLTQWQSIFLASFIFILLITFVFLYPRGKSATRKKTIEELEKKMKDCC